MDKFFHYKQELKTRYEAVKFGEKANFLLQPTDARFRDLCILIFKENKNRNDLNTFSAFFGFEYEDGITNKIKKQTSKFKPLQTYLKGETELAEYNYAGADMIAVLLDYEFRPFSKFLKEVIPEHVDEEPMAMVIPESTEREIVENRPSGWDIVKKYLSWITAAIILVAAGISISSYLLKKDCMEWKRDHFEMADCQCTDLNAPIPAPIYNYDAHIFRMRRIYPTSRTSFFDHKKPLVWYCKQNNEIEYFNAPGKHPVTGKSLKDITQYMVDKYFKK